jgi:hypothetical protein
VDRVRREHFCQLGGTLRINSEMYKDDEEKPERGTFTKLKKSAFFDGLAAKLPT